VTAPGYLSFELVITSAIPYLKRPPFIGPLRKGDKDLSMHPK
jgi:hypothetical protein